MIPNPAADVDVYAGPLWDSGAFREGWVEVHDGIISAVGHGTPPRQPTARGTLLPTPINAHTHTGDYLARGRIPQHLSLAELVEPPTGLKYQLLAAAAAHQRLESLVASCLEARASGTRILYDFREGGVAGSRELRQAAEIAGLDVVIFAAPEGREIAPKAETLDILAESDGLGLSAVRDVTPEAAKTQAAIARRTGKGFALHWSEGVHEPVEPILDLAPDFLVHAVQAKHGDLERLADADIPLVSCPRANARLAGTLPDVRGWLDAGLSVMLGTDNAMLQTVDVFAEMRFASQQVRGVTREELLGMAVDAPRLRLKVPGAMQAWELGQPADFIVLGGDNPWQAVFSPELNIVAAPWQKAATSADLHSVERAGQSAIMLDAPLVRSSVGPVRPFAPLPSMP